MVCWSNANAKSLQSCPTLCDPIDGSLPGSPVPGILQARTLEWVAISFSNAWKWKVKTESEVAQSCPTLSDPMDYSLPGCSVHGICQARVLEWGAIAFSRCADLGNAYNESPFLTSEQPYGEMSPLCPFNRWRNWGLESEDRLLSHFSHVRLCATP